VKLLGIDGLRLHNQCSIKRNFGVRRGGRAAEGAALEMSGRETTGVQKMISRLLKLLQSNPQAEVADEDLEWVTHHEGMARHRGTFLRSRLRGDTSADANQNLAAQGFAPTERVGAKPRQNQHVNALWAALLGHCCYFLRTSFKPQHISLAGAPPSQPTPATSMWLSSTMVSVAACMCLSVFGSKLEPPANWKEI
jgi:hypothetical protein